MRRMTTGSLFVTAVFLVGLVFSASAYDWKIAEIGGPDSERGPYEGGTVEFTDNGFIITAKGGDIWGGNIGATLVYVDGVVGDFTIEYTVVEHTGDPPTTWTKVGVMVAQDTQPDTPYVFLASMPSNDPVALNDKGCKLVTRPERGGSAGPGSNGFAPLSWPVRYRLVREGDLFTASLSFDEGATWQSIADPADGKEDHTTLAFTDPVVLGIAINGHNGGQTTGRAVIADVVIDGGGIATAVEPAGKAATTWGELKR